MEVPRFHASDPKVAECFELGRPCILHGCPLLASLSHWSVDHISEHLDSEEEWPVHCTPRDVRSVARVYGQGLGVGNLQEMEFDEFASMLTSGTTHCYAQALLLWAKRSRPSSDGRSARRLDAELDRIDWAWLHGRAAGSGSVEFDTCQLWCSNGGGITTPRSTTRWTTSSRRSEARSARGSSAPSFDAHPSPSP